MSTLIRAFIFSDYIGKRGLLGKGVWEKGSGYFLSIM
jgi:hypothetical protein